MNRCRSLRRDLAGFESFTVQQRGWSKTKNGALLKLAESAGFDAFLTADQCLQFQQNLANSKLRIVVSRLYQIASTISGRWCRERSPHYKKWRLEPFASSAANDRW
ncbi:MAG TPA: hypothetical protein VGQ21_19460 [Thermoanaerobaculia bacterium]|nr:hypothetical protein [Thermoanaerobaculia bacterium]